MGKLPNNWFTRPDAKDVFMTRVEKTTGCWVWLGNTSPFGYGLVGCEGRDQRAHRVAYKLFVGPVPDDLQIRHSCDNPPCVRPDHLLLGTREDNTQDAVERGRIASGDEHWTRSRKHRKTALRVIEIARQSVPSGGQHWTRRQRGKAQRNIEAVRGHEVRGAAHHASKLTEALVIEIRTQAAQGSTSVALAEQYGVDSTVIRDAVRGVTWAHVPGALPEAFVRFKPGETT